MKALRILLKILLFPVTVLLTILVSIGRFFTYFSAGMLYIVSFAIFATAIASMALLGSSFAKVWKFFLCAWLLSPYGIPYFAGLFVELIDLANDAIKSI